MHVETTSTRSAHGLRIGIVVSRYHDDVTTPLRAGAEAAFRDAGGSPDDIDLIEVPGSFELTAGCRTLAYGGTVDALVALGCIITGETTHDQYLANAVAHGLTSITVNTGVPIAFGVLTCQTIEQARERAGGAKGNKGAEAMVAMIEMIGAIRDGVKESAR